MYVSIVRLQLSCKVFFRFNFFIGLFWPAMGVLRSKYVPESSKEFSYQHFYKCYSKAYCILGNETTGNDTTSWLTVIARKSSLHHGIVTKRAFTNAKKQFKYRHSQQSAQFEKYRFSCFVFPLLVYCTEKSYLTVTCKVLDIYQIDLSSFTSFRFVSFRFREIQQAYSNYYFSCPLTELVAIDILPIIRSFFF